MDRELNRPCRAGIAYLRTFGISADKAAAAVALFFNETPVKDAADALNRLEHHVERVAERVICDETMPPAEKTARFQLMCLTRLNGRVDRLLNPSGRDIAFWRDCHTAWNFAGTPDEKRVVMVPQTIVPVRPFKALFGKIGKKRRQKAV